jgi:NADPH:quinone reductase-like Zn-dependent oxidoreductase
LGSSLRDSYSKAGHRGESAIVRRLSRHIYFEAHKSIALLITIKQPVSSQRDHQTMADSDSVPSTTLTILHNASDHTLKLTSHATPVPLLSQYLISVKATTFTAGELLWPEPNSLSDPIPGFDIAGTILQIPTVPPAPNQTYFALGTRVYGLTSFSRRANARGISIAEHDELAPIPAGLDFPVAASIPLSALTAWQVLFKHGELIPREGANTGKRVLVTAAAGGVGVWVVQIAAWAGAHVTGIAGAGNAELVRQLGASEVLDYKTTSIKEWVAADARRQFDLVLDAVGAKALPEYWTAVKTGGILESIVQPPESLKPSEGVNDDVKGLFFIVEPNGQELETLGQLVQQKKIRPMVDSVWRFEDFQKAWKRVLDGHVSGKVVLQVSE